MPPDYFSDTGQRWGKSPLPWRSRQAGVREQVLCLVEQRFPLFLDLVGFIRLDPFGGLESNGPFPGPGNNLGSKGLGQGARGKTFFSAILANGRVMGPWPLRFAEGLGVPLAPNVGAASR